MNVVRRRNDWKSLARYSLSEGVSKALPSQAILEKVLRGLGTMCIITAFFIVQQHFLYFLNNFRNLIFYRNFFYTVPLGFSYHSPDTDLR